MSVKICFEPSCKREAAYICSCTVHYTYSCDKHLKAHKKLPNKIHRFRPLFSPPVKRTKGAILALLEKEISDKEEVKKYTMDSACQHFYNIEKKTKEFLDRINLESAELHRYYEKILKIEKISILDEDPLINTLLLNPKSAALKAKIIISESIGKKDISWERGLIEKMIEYFLKCKIEIIEAKLIKIDMLLGSCNYKIEGNQLAELRNSISCLIEDTKKSKKEFEDWKKVPRMESEEFYIHKISEDLNKKLLNINKPKDKSLNPQKLKKKTPDKANIIKAEPDIRSNENLYLIKEDNEVKKLAIYDIENKIEKEEVLALLEPLNWGTCITTLPNNELFCFGSSSLPGIALIIDCHLRAWRIPSGTPCYFSSCIYLNKSVYCFGGQNHKQEDLTLCSSFNMDRNRWFKLASMPLPDKHCHSAIFNKNILISGYRNRNLLVYSTYINSFSVIPYCFAQNRRKILTNGERLYLVECSGGLIYESEAGDEYSWKQIGNSQIQSDPWQAYSSCNKGGEFYIATALGLSSYYYKFRMIKKENAESEEEEEEEEDVPNHSKGTCIIF